MLVTGAAKPEQSVLHPILLLCAQHYFVLLGYWYRTAYIVIVLGLETFFQWILFSNLELYVSNHWTIAVGALAIIFAHRIWICTGTISMLVTQSEVGRNDEEVGSSSGVSEAVEIIEINDIFVDSPLDIT
jgi:hypothetical protein